ncbi:MAG: GIY-YIG nuclease family protein, partial [Terriglobia bacterium]
MVVNFLNQNNEADQHVFRLLSEKFQLFEGVFGASDEVLGAIESGVDFEKRIVAIYQRCRTPQEIKTSFDQLQGELGTQIDEAMTRARQLLFEHFDDEVREKLRVSDENSRQYLNRYERILMQLTRFELRDHADFLTDSSFKLKSCPFEGDIPLGLYELPRRTGEAHLYRLAHPLAESVLEQAKSRVLEPTELTFEYGKHDGKVTVVEPFIGKSGVLNLSLFTVEALDQAEDYLICTGVTDDLPAPRPGIFFVYAIECEDGSHYIGQTDNLQRRWEEHSTGKGAEWTARNKPVRVAHYEEYQSRAEAVEREQWLKTGFGRKWLKREIEAGRARQAGGEALEEEVVRRLFSLPANVTKPMTSSLEHPTLSKRTEERQDAIRRQISQRNAEFFEIEVDKLDSWADDLKVGLEREIKEFDRQIK